jgi:hypothetical protein
MQYAVSGPREYSSALPAALPTMTTTSTAVAAAMTTTTTSNAIFAAKSRYIPRDAARPLRGARRSRKNLSESGKIHDDGNIPRMCRAPKIFRLVRDADTRPAESLCPPNRLASIIDPMHRRESTASDPVAALEAKSMDRPWLGFRPRLRARSEAVGYLRARSAAEKSSCVTRETRASSRARACLRPILAKDVASFASVCGGRDVTRDVTSRDRRS